MLKLFKKKEMPPFIDFIKGHFGSNIVLNGVGVGENLSDLFIKNLAINKLYLVDCEVSKNKDKVVCIEKKPLECYDEIPCNIHFVYINKKDSYDIKELLIFYLPKLMRNGIIGGNHFSGSDMKEVSFLTEFCRRSQLQLKGEGDYWWIIKT